MGDADPQYHRTVASIVSEIKADLTSREVKELLSRLRTVTCFKLSYQDEEWTDAIGILLQFYVCRMLISLLEAGDILLGLSLQGAIYETTSFLEWLQNAGLFSDQFKFLFTDPKFRVLLPRMLCIAGLSLDRIKNSECMSPILWFVLTFKGSTWVISQLQMLGESYMADCLEQFWESPSVPRILELLDMRCITSPNPPYAIFWK